MTDQDWKDNLSKLSKQHKAQEQHKREQELLKKQQEAKQDINFAQMMSDVKRLPPSNRYTHTPPKPHARVINKQHDRDTQHDVYIGEYNSDNTIAPKQYWASSQSKKSVENLLSGKYTVVSVLDLHGYTQEETQVVLNEFAEYVRSRGVCGEIIHGSGLNSRGFSSKLKQLVRHWLMENSDVLAYTEPHQNDGAVLVLFKRKRIDKTEY